MNQQAGAHALSHSPTVAIVQSILKTANEGIKGTSQVITVNISTQFHSSFSSFLKLCTDTQISDSDVGVVDDGIGGTEGRRGSKRQDAGCGGQPGIPALLPGAPPHLWVPSCHLTLSLLGFLQAAGFFLVNCKLRSLTKCPKTIDI